MLVAGVRRYHQSGTTNRLPLRCAGRYVSSDLTQWRLNHYLYPDADDSTDPRACAEVDRLLGIHVEGIALRCAHEFPCDRTHNNPQLYEDRPVRLDIPPLRVGYEGRFSASIYNGGRGKLASDPPHPPLQGDGTSPDMQRRRRAG